MSEKILGSVSARGDKWLAQLPPSMGRRGKIHSTEQAAQQWLREENAKHTLGIGETGQPGGAAPVGSMILAWLEANPVKQTTREDYRIRIDKHIIGHPASKLAIRDFLPLHVDAILTNCPENWTRIHVSKILSAFCDWAEANRLTVGNPYRQSNAKRISQVQYRKNERKQETDAVWTPEQFIAFLEHEGDPVYRDYWAFTAATGARRGEAVGLRWVNLSTAEGWCWLHDNVTVSGNLILHESTPKNHKRRKAYFGPVVGRMLEARRIDQEEYRQGFTDDEWCPEGWVFDKRRGWGKRMIPGSHLNPHTVTQRFNRHSEELGLPRLAGPHGLRRTFGTLAEDEGFKPSVRRDALGHSPDVAGRYTKAKPEQLHQLADRITELLLGGRK